jgi:predicted  nucleic acid-binding Zn-ribbon protein
MSNSCIRCGRLFTNLRKHFRYHRKCGEEDFRSHFCESALLNDAGEKVVTDHNITSPDRDSVSVDTSNTIEDFRNDRFPGCSPDLLDVKLYCGLDSHVELQVALYIKENGLSHNAGDALIRLLKNVAPEKEEVRKLRLTETIDTKLDLCLKKNSELLATGRDDNKERRAYLLSVEEAIM